MTEVKSTVNKYIDIYINNYVKPFRAFITSNYKVSISGISGFIATDDHDLSFLLYKLQEYGFEVTISNGRDTLDEIEVEYTIRENVNNELFEYKIENLVSTIYLSSKTGISIIGMLVMQIISQIICKSKIIYKAIVLDLDDTIWQGTLAEDGIDTIKQNLRSSDAIPFIEFMRFIQTLAKELGIIRKSKFSRPLERSVQILGFTKRSDFGLLHKTKRSKIGERTTAKKQPEKAAFF